ncbi:uncharacterized protein LOC104447319 [Eucalyptus grandis]|uniref:uncharacterized protein LOC104447319 n=1 Tax=Eucalyptus grandis TaxID=71139 RepID=UPI00192ECBD4|nr:uncharacterized protein LOC104447319 [Eucalyptus grandis]
MNAVLEPATFPVNVLAFSWKMTRILLLQTAQNKAHRRDCEVIALSLSLSSCIKCLSSPPFPCYFCTLCSATKSFHIQTLSQFLKSSAEGKEIMSPQKRGLPSTSSGQASLLRRPRTARTNQTWRRSGRNLVQRSWYMEQVVRRVVREELERAEKSRLAEYCQSCTGNGLEDLVRSLENTVQKLVS